MTGKPKLAISVSGGRTSAFMAEWCKANLVDQYDMVFTMANTSFEDPDTLRFANEVDKHFGLNLVWLEAVVNRGRKACTHKVVTFETARRNAEIFYEVCAKYGLPNHSFKLCTRELKLNPMKSYMRSIGWKNYTTAIGIRADETRRVSDTAEAQKIIYPLVNMIPTDKEDVLAYFEQFEWDLRIPEHDGNCQTCFKKSDRKLQRIHQEHPDRFVQFIALEMLYDKVGPNNVPGPRKIFRGYRDTSTLLDSFRKLSGSPAPSITDGGCSESCEVFDTN